MFVIKYQLSRIDLGAVSRLRFKGKVAELLLGTAHANRTHGTKSGERYWEETDYPHQSQYPIRELNP